MPVQDERTKAAEKYGNATGDERAYNYRDCYLSGRFLTDWDEADQNFLCVYMRDISKDSHLAGQRVGEERVIELLRKHADEVSHPVRLSKKSPWRYVADWLESKLKGGE